MPAPVTKDGAPRLYEILSKQADDERMFTLDSDTDIEHDWREYFDERQQKEIEFADYYAANFHHGTTGHNQLMIIAQMAQVIDFIFNNFDLRGRE